MDFVRALHRKKYKQKARRFHSDSFKNLNGAISIIDVECIQETSTDTCGHIEHFYKSVICGKPFAFWVIRHHDLETHFGKGQFSIVPKTSDSGDECHRNLTGVDNKPASRFQRDYCKESDIFWCMQGGCVPLTEELDKILQRVL